MKTYRIAAIPGDGIGTEVIAAGCLLVRDCTINPATTHSSH